MVDPITSLRALIPDTDQVFDGEYLFTDDQLQVFIDIHNGNLLRAAGQANLAIASSEALISKVIRTQDLQTNGADLANSFRLIAAQHFSNADAADATLAEGFNLVYPVSYEHPELTEWNY